MQMRVLAKEEIAIVEEKEGRELGSKQSKASE
jgi:hypothetical protein